MSGLPFTKYHWNRLDKGATVVVTLTKAANVRLMDSSNFTSFKNGRAHKYLGGLAKTSPFRITVPRTGSWYLSVDLMGLKATSVRSSVAVEPPALPVAKSAPPQSLSGIRHERPPVVPDDDGETWDVFISHASEDKASVAEPLATATLARSCAQTCPRARADMPAGEQVGFGDPLWLDQGQVDRAHPTEWGVAV